jgi:hypothetical protein
MFLPLQGSNGSISLRNTSADEMLNNLFAEEANERLIAPFEDVSSHTDYYAMMQKVTPLSF